MNRCGEPKRFPTSQRVCSMAPQIIDLGRTDKATFGAETRDHRRLRVRPPLQQFDPLRRELLAHFCRPQSGLNLSDVNLAQQEHAHPGLSDAATNGQRQLTVE